MTCLEFAGRIAYMLCICSNCCSCYVTKQCNTLLRKALSTLFLIHEKSIIGEYLCDWQIESTSSPLHTEHGQLNTRCEWLSQHWDSNLQFGVNRVKLFTIMPLLLLLFFIFINSPICFFQVPRYFADTLLSRLWSTHWWYRGWVQVCVCSTHYYRGEIFKEVRKFQFLFTSQFQFLSNSQFNLIH